MKHTRIAVLLPWVSCIPMVTTSVTVAADIVYLEQGSEWTNEARKDFYTADQGSRLIPLKWLNALKQSDGVTSLTKSLERYGYLAENLPHKLPVGFTLTGPSSTEVVGMTCAACHTRQITAEGKTYRIDGGPAIVDFQGFLNDLDLAVERVLASDASFDAFARDVFGRGDPSASDVNSLKRQVQAWYRRFHTIVSRSLPPQKWGPGRLDAVGMIFNRISGLDIGTGPDHMIPDNINVADAPARYPFLWNAHRQDKTQWPGIASNGSDTLALGRNLGQVYGVFAVFTPKRGALSVNYLNQNSANFDGLARLEQLIKKIKPPKWPWSIDSELASQGRQIFERDDKGNCKACHGIKPGVPAGLFSDPTWLTRLQNVQTDTRQGDLLNRDVKTGVLSGAFKYGSTERLQETDKAINVLQTAVIGTIVQSYMSVTGQSELAPTGAAGDNPEPLPPELKELQGVFVAPASGLTGAAAGIDCASPRKGCYEARVLEGIWAAAPYLHNGSVPTLADLLKPATERPTSFHVGNAYDPDRVGLAPTQTQFDYMLETTDCDQLNSGNSRCGHEYGTSLSADEKKQLLEYLKTL